MTLGQKLRINKERKLQAQAASRLIAQLDEVIVGWNPQFVATADLINSPETNEQLSRKMLGTLKESRQMLSNMLFVDSPAVWECVDAINKQLHDIPRHMTSSEHIMLQAAVDEIQLTLRKWVNL